MLSYDLFNPSNPYFLKACCIVTMKLRNKYVAHAQAVQVMVFAVLLKQMKWVKLSGNALV